MNDKSKIVSVTFCVQLEMYGFAHMQAFQTDDGLTTAWVAADDSCQPLEKSHKTYKDKNISDLISALLEIDIPNTIDDSSCKEWSVAFYGENDEFIKGNEMGYWLIDVFDQILNTVETYLGDDASTTWLKDVANA